MNNPVQPEPETPQEVSRTTKTVVYLLGLLMLIFVARDQNRFSSLTETAFQVTSVTGDLPQPQSFEPLSQPQSLDPAKEELALNAGKTPRPTAAPTGITSKNATIVNGHLTIFGVTSYVGTYSSNINSVIMQYFPKTPYKQMVVHTEDTVWMNSSVALSYLTLVGNYTADVPIVLPNQFILVMDGASLNAVPDFPTNKKSFSMGGVTVMGNPHPDTNELSISATNWAIIVMNNVYYSGVVSPGGPSQAYIGCRSMPFHSVADIVVGPAGVYTSGAGATIIDGIHIDNCGLNNGNVALYGTSRSEVANCVLQDARTRGLWVLIMAFSIIHDNEIFGSMKFGLDLDANAGPVSLVYKNYIHDNSYQGVFIEQGAQFSVVNDNDLPRNQNGVSFYNNLFAQYCSDSVILSNKCYESTGAGINVGSLNDNIIGYWPTTDTYIVGNMAYDNGKLVPIKQEKMKYGFNSNGPAHGIFLIANSDSQGQGQAMWKFMNGGAVISDPLQRMKVASGITPTASPTTRPTIVPKSGSKPVSQPTFSPSAAPSAVPTTRVSALNVTIINGVLVSYVGQPLFPLEIDTIVGTTTSSLQAFVTKYFGSLLLGSASRVPWMWQPGVKQIMSFLTLIGDYVCDVSLSLPRQLVLVLEGATITADDSKFSSSSPGMIVADGAHFSYVVSPGGASTATIDCGTVSGPAGIYIFNSSYFSVDGISVKNCGKDHGAITIMGTSEHDIGNSTSVINSVVSSSTGHGIYISRVIRPVLYMNSITSSAGSGIMITGESYGPILSGNIISKNGEDGVTTAKGTRNSVIRGNLISGNSGSGIAITNSDGKKSVIRTVIVSNEIVSNLKYSIYLGVDEMSYMVSTVIGGNKIRSNAYGLYASDPSKKGIQKTLLAHNDDSNGIMDSFLSLTNGNSANGASGNYFLDPMDRGVYYDPQKENKKSWW